MIVEVSARSHIGKVREENEDNLFIDGVKLSMEDHNRPFAIDGSMSAPVVLAVCDGMGGEENGEVASFLAVKELEKLNTSIKANSVRNLHERVQQYANMVRDEIQSVPENMGKRSGTTLAMAVITKRGVYCFNVGDTRIYCLRKGRLRQVTNDHTVAAAWEQNGRFPEEQVTFEKNRHKLTRCIGIGSWCGVEGYPTLYGRNRILICSDGLTDMVPPPNVEMILKGFMRASDAADRLVFEALENGGRDNITVIVADVAAVPAFIGRTADKYCRKS